MQQIHFIDNRRAVGVRSLNESEDIMQFPVICAADIVEADCGVGVTMRAADVTCGDCEERLAVGRTTTVWKIDGREVEIEIPVSRSTEEAQARVAAAEARSRRIYAGLRRVRADG